MHLQPSGPLGLVVERFGLAQILAHRPLAQDLSEGERLTPARLTLASVL